MAPTMALLPSQPTKWHVACSRGLSRSLALSLSALSGSFGNITTTLNGHFQRAKSAAVVVGGGGGGRGAAREVCTVGSETVGLGEMKNISQSNQVIQPQKNHLNEIYSHSWLLVLPSGTLKVVKLVAAWASNGSISISQTRHV